MTDYTVFDALATREPRRHLIRLPDGNLKEYKLSASEPTAMSMEHAMKFLCDEHFIVLDEKGKTVKAQPSTEQFTHVAVPNGFVMAALDELSRDALFKRCKLLDGSEAIHPLKSSREQMVAFLQGKDTKASAPEKTHKTEEVDFGDEVI